VPVRVRPSQLETLLKVDTKGRVKTPPLIHEFTFSSVRPVASASLFLVAGLLFASSLAGKSAEPGPEAEVHERRIAE
jgi:hypothetical protein